MIDWLKVEDNRKKLVYEQVAANEGLPSIAIEKDLPGTINLVPPDASIKQWQDDYGEMQESMIYADSVSFDKLIDRMKEVNGENKSIGF